MFSKQANTVPFVNTRPTGEEVRLAVGDGRWMTMQQATFVTGLSERTLRRHIKKGAVKFRRNGKQKNSPVELWITPEVSKFVEQVELEDQDDNQTIEIFDVVSDDSDGEAFDTTPESAINPTIQSAPRQPSETEVVMRSITEQFLERLDKTNEMLYQLRIEMQDKERQLKLLPDLQKQADEKQLAELKSIALEKQIEQLKQINEKLQQEAAAAAEKSRLAEEKKSWWKKLFASDNLV